MCPPIPVSRPAEIDEFWTDEGICTSVLNFKTGCPLPLNVTSDVNPYEFKPSDLPADLWYFCSRGKTDVECGFWLEKGEACEIVSNSTILGSRTTLQFYEGQAPNARKTKWLMQEYKISEKSNNNMKDNRALCRVFLADENGPASNDPIDVTNPIDSGPKTVSNTNNTGHISKSELLENDTGPSLVVKRSPNRLESFREMDCFLTGDYLCLDDLVDPGSRPSSSANSSCPTMTSEEYFDSMALLRELEDDITDHEMKGSSVKYNLSISGKSKEVVIRPAASGSVKSSEERKISTEAGTKVENGNGSASNGVKTTALCSSSEGASKERKKERGGGKKKQKMMKYLCFIAF